MSAAVPPQVAVAGRDWWTVEDLDELTLELEALRSRLAWITEPAWLARWVLDDQSAAPLDGAPAGVVDHWASGLDRSQHAAWALTGWFIRMTVPEATRTAGVHWLASNRVVGGRRLLRVTVGKLETFGVHESGDGVWLRVALAPLVLAAEAGVIDLDAWQERGVDGFDDTTKTLAEDKVALSVPDVDTALWLLRQPPVLAAARMLNLLMAAGGNFPHASRYRPEIAARAWLAAERLFAGPASPARTAVAASEGFDRPYTGVIPSADLPAQRSFDGDAYRAGVSEHDRLCRALINHLSADGVRVGAGLHGVPVDLAWRDADGRQFIAEVKSVIGDNEIEQLRLGLGQVLEYRHRLAARGIVAAPVLLVSRCTDQAWLAICGDNHVILLQGQGASDWTAALTKGRHREAALTRPASTR
ncbi:hypothetical protein [Micromonospora musae]|uniref:hypothetical protein n=1 Tax=Micromonospora musae TaxID=1894970 RepID=UPI00340A7BEE